MMLARWSVLVTCLAVSAAAGQAPRPLVEDFRIDGVEHEFSSILGVLPLSNGNVFVLHPGDFAASLYGPAGTEIRKFARKGAGPGEVQSLATFGLLGDTLWLADRSQNRITFFAPDGSTIRSIVVTERANWEQLRPGSSGAYNTLVMPRVLLPDDVALGSPGTIVDAMMAGTVKSIPLVRTSWSGAVAKIIADQPLRIVPPLEIRTDRPRRAAQPFRVNPMLEVSRNGRHVALIDAVPGPRPAVRIVRMDDQGRTAATFDVPYDPVAIPARVTDSIVTAIATAIGIPRDEAAVRAQLDVPKTYPPVDLALVANDGSIWLRRPALDRQRVWTVVSPAGKILETLSVPASTSLRWIDGSVWGVSRDADDVPSIVRLKRK